MSPLEGRHPSRLFLHAEVLTSVRATRSMPCFGHRTLLGSLTDARRPGHVIQLFPGQWFAPA